MMIRCCPRLAPALWTGMSVLVLIGTGCKPGTARSSTFAPAKTGISNTWFIADKTTGGTGGDARLEAKPGEVVAGFERFYASDPTRIHQNFYRGAVRFDLAEIGKLKSKVIDKATLTYKVSQSYVRTPDGKPIEFPNLTSCATELLVANEDWTKMIGGEGYATTLFPGDPVITKLASATPPGGTFTVDVTEAARNWLAKPGENFGVVLKGSNEARTGAANDACATRYGEFALQVNFTVFEE